MTLELALRPPFSPPHALRAQGDESRQEVHWVGQARGKTPPQNGGDGNPSGPPKREKDRAGYRPLAGIGLGEVETALGLFEGQIVPVQENWIGKNHFCTLPLKRIRDGRPPLVFGFVRTCYPSDGYLENVEELELLFPRRDGPPDLLRIHRDEVSRYSQRTVQSHALRVQFKVSGEEQAEFAGAVAGFVANGFHPEFDAAYYDLLERSGPNEAHPLLHVVGSRWFASIPDSRILEVATRLKEMLGWGDRIFNYHPHWLPLEVHTLNRELGFQYGFTSEVLVEPRDPAQTLLILTETRRRLFEAPQNRASLHLTHDLAGGKS